jgi:uncharacterized protein YndB with AHSA1/START domain/GNAT superfamily N-acetyltransferase
VTSPPGRMAQNQSAKPRDGGGAPEFSFHPLTPDRWRDLETLFGPRGACGGCWCMAWRLTPAEFGRRKGDGNRRALRSLVTKGATPGILAYDGDAPVGWCAVAPREATPRLEQSRVLARLDDAPVWSVTCFFVAKAYRRQGVTVALLRAAAAYAGGQGARILEGYPMEPRQDELPAAFAWTGLAAAFREAGFAEVARRSATRPIFRLALRKSARGGSGATARRAGAGGAKAAGSPAHPQGIATSIIVQERVFAATPEELFRAFAQPRIHSAFTGAAATGRTRAGARFTAWDGYITGKTLEVEPGRRIVQEWRTTEWPEGAAPSHLELSFFDHPRGVRVALRQTDVPRTQAGAYRSGWNDYYWKPLRAWLAAQRQQRHGGSR